MIDIKYNIIIILYNIQPLGEYTQEGGGGVLHMEFENSDFSTNIYPFESILRIWVLLSELEKYPDS